LFPNTEINVTKSDRKELTNMAQDLLNQIDKNPSLSQKLYNLIVGDYSFEQEIMNMETPSKVMNSIKKLFEKLLIDSGLSKKAAKAELKNKLPAFYKAEMQVTPSSLTLYDPDLDPRWASEEEEQRAFLKEDRKIQERRRIYELGESHASLLRKKYYGRR